MENHDSPSFNERIEKLEREMLEIRRRLDYLTGSGKAGIQRVSEADAVRVQPTLSPAAGTSPPLPPPRSFLEHTPSEPLRKPSPPSRTREEWETLIGGKLLNRIGALALILGMGFFLKYAFDNNWISETVRVLIGGGIGVLLLAGAWRFRSRGLQVFAQGLLGAGIAILYLSAYASFIFYHLVPLAAAFVLMSVVTLTAFLHAVRYDSFAVSLLGWFGGFLTPFLLSSGEANETGLFTYILLLDIGLAAIFLKKTSWTLLELLTFAATWATYILWHGAFYSEEKLGTTIVFLTLFWGVFLGLDIAMTWKRVISFPRLRHWIYSLNAVIYYVALYIILNARHSNWTAPAALAPGAVYFLTVLGGKRFWKEAEDHHDRRALIAIALLAVATGIHFSGYALVIAWSLEALALVWSGTYWRMPPVWMAALGLFAFAVMSLIDTIKAAFEPLPLVFNQRALAFTTLAAALYGSIPPLGRFSGDQSREIRAALHYGWSAVLFAFISVEAHDCALDLASNRPLLMITAGWMIYALPMTWTGLRSKTAPVLQCGLGAALLAAGVAIITGFSPYDPITRFMVVMNGRTAVMLFLIAGSFLLNFCLDHTETSYPWLLPARRVLQLGVVLLAFSLITVEARDIFQKQIALLSQNSAADMGAAINRLENLRQLSLSGLWLAYSLLLTGLGIWRRLQPLRMLAIGLFGFTILKIFIYDLSFLDTLYRIFSFIGLGIILLGVSYVYQRYKSVIFGGALHRE